MEKGAQDRGKGAVAAGYWLERTVHKRGDELSGEAQHPGALGLLTRPPDPEHLLAEDHAHCPLGWEGDL